MTRPVSARSHVVHLALLLGALAVAYVVPFELFLLSYAVLGPLHYFTEISWLHDRRYFLPSRWLGGLLCLVALGAMFVADASVLGYIVCLAFAGCAVLALTGLPRWRAIGLALAIVVFATAATCGVRLSLAWLLIPTLVHVSLFTFVFMVTGALRSRSTVQAALALLYVLAIVLIVLLPPTRGAVLPQLAAIGQDYFGDVAPALGAAIGVPGLAFDARFAGLLSFIYTYHYLNWFIKVDVIRWADVPRKRLVTMVALAAAATALYFYDYRIGFMVLVLLSLAHVLLEFPLNAISLRDLGGAIAGTGRRPRAAATGARAGS